MNTRKHYLSKQRPVSVPQRTATTQQVTNRSEYLRLDLKRFVTDMTDVYQKLPHQTK